MIVSVLGGIVIVFSIALIGPSVVGSSQAAERLEWSNTTVFERNSVNEDVKTVLRAALKQNGMASQFRAGVEGTISQAFANAPPEGVFNMIIETFELDYTYDESRRIVTIFPRAVRQEPVSDHEPVLAASAPSAARTATANETSPRKRSTTESATAPPLPAAAETVERARRAAPVPVSNPIPAPATSSAAPSEDPEPVLVAAAQQDAASGSPSPATARPRQAAAAVRDIVWKPVAFERISFEEDIRDVFRAIARANGMQVLFRPDVEGEISFEFRDMDLRAAFRKLIEENGLDYAYDQASNTVTLFKAVSVERREQLIALNYISVERMRSAARQLNLRGEIVADPASGIVLVKGTTEDVRRLADLAGKLDQAEAERQKQITEDRAAEAREAEAEAKRLEALAKQRGSESDAAERRAAAEERRLALEAKAKEAELRQKAIENILNTEIRIIPVKYASVGPTTQAFRGKQVTIPGIDETLRNLLGIGGKDETASGGDNNNATLVAEVRSELGLTPPQISVDTRTNSIIVSGSQRAVAQVEDLVKRLDKRLPLVEIEVIIVAAQKGVSAELGIKYGTEGTFRENATSTLGFAANTGLQGTQTSNENSIDRQVNATTVTNNNDNSTTLTPTETTVSVDPLSALTLLPTGSDATVASFVLRGSSLALQAELRALSRDNKAQTISSPRIITLNNLAAKVTNDRTRFIRTAAGANSSGTLEEINAGLTLDITPSVIESEISGDVNLIRLVVNASNKDVSLSSAGDASVTGAEVQTQVEIPDGATFMLGGLVDDTRVESKDGVPGLQDIPLIGNLFKSRSSQDDLSETIFFITPRLLRSEDLYASDIAQRRYMDTQRARLHNMRHDLQVNSQLLTIQSVTLEEDE